MRVRGFRDDVYSSRRDNYLHVELAKETGRPYSAAEETFRLAL